MAREYVSKAMMIERDDTLRDSYPLLFQSTLLPDELLLPHSGTAALDMIKSGQVHIDDLAVVTITASPDDTMSSSDFFSALRQQEYLGEVIIITGDVSVQPSKNIPTVIHKPYNINDLRGKIMSCIKEHERKSFPGRR